MLNPAWRPAQLDNPALTTIKQQYQYPKQRRMDSFETANRIPVICAPAAHHSREDIEYLANALERQLNLPDTSQINPDQLWSLTSLDEHKLSRSQPPTLILILVEASLDALQLAYSHIKPLQYLRDTSFSVIVHGARDTETGRRYYRRLAMGAIRFLDLPLLYCGIAPERGHTFSQGIATLAHKIKQSPALYESLNHAGVE